jgi:hypothetical protein
MSIARGHVVLLSLASSLLTKQGAFNYRSTTAAFNFFFVPALPDVISLELLILRVVHV